MKRACLLPQVTLAGGEEFSAKVVGVVSVPRAARQAAYRCVLALVQLCVSVHGQGRACKHPGRSWQLVAFYVTIQVVWPHGPCACVTVSESWGPPTVNLWRKRMAAAPWKHLLVYAAFGKCRGCHAPQSPQDRDQDTAML